MEFFFHILANNIIPIFSLIILGFILGNKFDLDIFTLSKLNFYVFVPSFILVNLYTTEIPREMTTVLSFAIVLLVLNIVVSNIIARVRNYDTGMSSAFKNSVMFYNSGNIGLPLITLVFANPPFAGATGHSPFLGTALTAQIMVLVVQNITTNTLGFFNAGRATLQWQHSVLKVLKMPTVYAIPLAVLLKSLPFDATQLPIWPALEYARSGLIPVALITLGIQLSQTRIEIANKEVYLSVFFRLLGGPILALIILYFTGIRGALAQVLLISSSVPSSVNSALIAVEMDNYSGFASQAVMLSTLFSAVSLTLVILTARILFPI